MQKIIKNKINEIIKTPISSSIGLITILFLLVFLWFGKITETGLLGLIPALWAIFSNPFKENINK